MTKIGRRAAIWVAIAMVSLSLTGCFKDSPTKATAQCEFEFNKDEATKHQPDSYGYFLAKANYCRICMQRKGYTTSRKFHTEQESREIAENVTRQVLDNEKVAYSQSDLDSMVRSVLHRRAGLDAKEICSPDIW